MIEQFYDLRPEVLALDRKALDLCRAQFAHVEEIRDYNQLKMLRAFTDCGVEARHFWGSSGYGVWDDSRNKLEEVFARCMGAEAALVRPQFMSGTHTLTVALFGLLRTGDTLLAAILVLAVMILPFIEVRAEKAFREVPAELVRSSYSLGCSKLYTITRIVLPACRGELVSGIILGGCYAMGATAPMIFTGAVAYAAVPDSIFSPAMALPLHLYLLVAQGSTSMDTAYGTAFVMMAMILLSSLLATAYARRSQNRWKRS